MVTLLDAINTLHTRGLNITIDDYVFATLVVIGEDTDTAYAIAYDKSELAKHIGKDDESTYIESKRKDADNIMQQQQIVQLIDVLKESYRAEIQRVALDLKDYHFTSEEAVQILNNILKNRVQDIDSASVRDVVSVIKQLTEQGALETGDGGFSRHFITVPKKYDSYCPKCNRELYAVEGLDIKCEHCGQMYLWRDNRFYPSLEKL